MQSVTQKFEPGYAGSSEVRHPVRPEPFVSDRLYRFRQTGFTATPSTGGGSRFALAEAFRKLGRGVHGNTAFDRTRDFFRSSGHAWSRGLSR